MGIYFVQFENGPIKIGFASGDPHQRFAALQSANHATLKFLALVPGGMADERKFHEKFSSHHLKGEWFKPAPELLKFIATLPPPPGKIRKQRERRPTSWSKLNGERRASITRIWFDKTIGTNKDAAAKAKLNVQTIQNNLGPSGRLRDYQAAQAASVLSRVGDRSAKKRRAEKIWFNGKLSIREKEALSGVPQSTLYAWFGKTRVPKEHGKK